MSEWQDYKLGTLIELLTDYHSNGSYKTLKANVELLDEESYAVMIRTKNFEQNDFSKELKYINEHAYNHLSKSKVFPDDIIMNKIANAGSIYRMPYIDKPVSLAMNLFLIRIDKHKANQVFMYYYLKQNEKYIKTFAEGSVTKTITKEAVRNLDVCIPVLAIQEEIVRTLNNIDKKITLLCQQNQDLEELAQTLFKRWFVEFEFPNENGETYKSSGGKMVESEMGEIPEGWRAGKLEDITLRITDGSHFSPESVDNGMPMASVKDMNDWNFDIDSCRRISQDDYNELVKSDCKPLKGDILIAKDGSYLKHVFVAPKDLDVVLLSSIAMIRPNDSYRPILLAIFLKLNSTIREMKNIVSGAVIERIVLKDFRKFKLIVPSKEIQFEASKVIEPLIEKCWSNIEEIQTLSQLRDTLLPKLMSGELRVITE